MNCFTSTSDWITPSSWYFTTVLPLIFWPGLVTALDNLSRFRILSESRNLEGVSKERMEMSTSVIRRR